jgi:Ca-activated chloride channel family protein
MKLKCFCTFLFLINVSVGVFSQKGHQQLRKGDKAYGARKYEQAEKHYREAEKEQADFRSSYNLGNTYMQQNRYDDAAQKYNQAAETTNDATARAAIFHNLGNALFSKEKYRESIEAYKKALLINPTDQETIENMMLAKKMLRKQQDQQQKESDKKSKEKNSDSSENQMNHDRSKSKDHNEEGSGQNMEKSEKQENQGLQGKGSGMSSQDANQLLDVMTNEEKRVQRKLTTIKGETRSGRKDW